MGSRPSVFAPAVSDLGRRPALDRQGPGLGSAAVIRPEFVGDEAGPPGALAAFDLEGNLILAPWEIIWNPRG